MWAATIPLADLRAKGIDKTIYYGYRAWGPNWPFTAAGEPAPGTGFVRTWTGRETGSIRNKLLLDPYALEGSAMTR